MGVNAYSMSGSGQFQDVQDGMPVTDYEKGIGDYIAAFKRKKGAFLITVVIMTIIALTVAFSLPAVFKSTATILIEQQDIPQDMVRTTITTFADQRIQVISQRVMTTKNLFEIIDKYGLYVDERKKKTREEVIQMMRGDIEFNMVSASVKDPSSGRSGVANIAFQLAFNSESPIFAQKVANELVSLYLSENLRSRARKAAETSTFLGAETERLGLLIGNLEAKLAEFKEKNKDQLPELMSLNMQLLQRAEQEVLEVERKMQLIEDRKVFLEAQLAQIDRMKSLFTETGGKVMGPQERLKALKSQIVSMSSKYSEDHPDVIKIHKEISALELEVGEQPNLDLLRIDYETKRTELAEIRKQYSSDHPDVRVLEQEITSLEKIIAGYESASATRSKAEEIPDNPAFIQLQSQLETGESELKSLRKRRDVLREKLSDLESRITNTPQVEREFKNLSRDYNNAVAKYQEVKAKQLQAEMSEVMEKESKGERFSLIEPPLLPEKPDKPNRIAIIFLGLVLSLACGLGVVAISAGMDHSIRGIRGVISVVGVAPLAEIPFMADELDIKKSRKKRIVIFLSIIGFMIFAIIAVHFLYKPLDVLWYVVMRKLGI
jgi:uncharacterized protein involved in exopolysaccharide biosynthesis